MQTTQATPPTLPDFFNPDTLRSHIAASMAFYYPRCVDNTGGFFHFFLDDGTVYDAQTRHLVSSTRFIYTFARAWREFGDPAFAEQMRHGLRFLREVHYESESGAYTWLLDWKDGQKRTLDPSRHCYGMAFVLLAYAQAVLAGEEEAKAWLAECFATMEQHFWQEEYGLHADEADAHWILSPYRGQNANMHACEALLCAWEATHEERYLQRASRLAHNICRRQASPAGMIWEHYDQNWQTDWDYNRHDPANLFRPWGYQPGHFTEWAKLLLTLEAAQNSLRPGSAETWLLPRAQQLFALATTHAWDQEYGGLYYGFAPDGSICDSDKYFWVQAESIACAAMLHARTGDIQYRTWYLRLWQYSWQHLIDHQHGAWYRILRRDNSKISNQKSPAGKVDYHTMGACHDVLGWWRKK